MKMTREKFIEVLTILLPSTKTLEEERIALPKIMEMAALKCFLENKEKEFPKEVAVLKDCLIELHKYGYVKFL